MTPFIEYPRTGKGCRTVPTVLYGVAVNDATYRVRHRDALGNTTTCPYYQKWVGMLQRVYCAVHRAQNPTYAGCSVEPAWLSFMTFRAWMETQDWQDKDLDKDLLDQGNKHYGPTTCLFIPQALNKLICLNGAQRGIYPVGVSLEIRNNRTRFQAKGKFFGRTKNLGRFDTPEEAAEVYKQAKLAHIAKLASTETDPRLKQALLRLF